METLTTGKSAEAIVEFKRALQLAPGSDEGYRRLGSAYRTAGRKDDAIQAYRHAFAFAGQHLGQFWVLLEKSRKIIMCKWRYANQSGGTDPALGNPTSDRSASDRPEDSARTRCDLIIEIEEMFNH